MNSDRTSIRPNDAVNHRRTKRAKFVPKEMKESVFRYEKTPKENHPLQPCYFGNYCKNAANRLREEDEEEHKYKCVIMDYEHDRAVEQINLSHKMGVEYALEVLHVDNKNESNSEVKVIYRHFENTVSGWLEKLEEEKLAKASEINKRLKDEVIPITRKLWKLLVEMEKKMIRIPKENNDQGYWMPLISGVPLVLNLYEGQGNPDLINYPVTVIEKVTTAYSKKKKEEKVLGGEKDEPLVWLKMALNFWKGNSKPKPSLYDAGKHPVLYDSAEKLEFLALFHRCTVDYELEPWLNKIMKWEHFRRQFKGLKFENVYVNIEDYRKFSFYNCGSDVVRYTRNALVHFADNYKRIYGTPWDGGQIVEMLDEELAVCSLLYTPAMEIIKNRPPKDLTEEGWKETQAKKWKDLKAQVRARARAGPRPLTSVQIAKEVFSEAYQPAPLEIYTNAGWKRLTNRIVADRQLLFKTDVGWKKGREVFNGANQRPRLWTWRKGSWEGWRQAREIEDEADQRVPLKFSIQGNGWKTMEEIFEADQPPTFDVWYEGSIYNVWKLATEIIQAEQPPSLCMYRGGNSFRLDAFEVHQPRKFLKQDNWNKAKQKLKDFLDSLK